MKALLLFILFISCCFVFSQNQSIENLQMALAGESSPIKKSNLCNSIGDIYRYTNSDSAVYFHKKALQYANAAKIDSLIAKGHYKIAVIEATRNHYIEALTNCDSAFKYFQITGNTHQLAEVRNVQGGVNMVSGNNEEACKLFLEAIKYTEDDTATARILFTYHNLVILLNDMKKHTLALEYAMKQYNWAKRLKINDEIAYACANIADIYADIDSIGNAQKYILELQDLTKETSDPSLKVSAKNYLGIFQFHKKNYSLAVTYYIEALDLNNGLPDQQLSCNILINLGVSYQKLNMLVEADSCFFKAIELSTTLDIKEERKDAYEQLMENARLQNDYKKAFHFSALFKKLSDTLLNEQNQQAVAEAESKYKSEQKTREIELLNATNEIQKSAIEKQKLLKNIIIGSAIFLMVIGVLFFNRYKLKKKIERQQVLLKERKRISRDLHDDVGATLSSVKLYSEILKDNPDNPVVAELICENTSEMIEKLEVIAWTANPKNDSFESLQGRINRYAVPLCHAKNITYRFSVENITTEITMPGEIRQNLFLSVKEAVNNMIKYAEAENCCIEAAIETEKFILKITDDGKGFDDNGYKEGNGLHNMGTRIKEIGGEIFISSIPGRGTTIKVQLSYPFKIPDIWDNENKIV